MGIYDQRTKPAYRIDNIHKDFANNQYILDWWSSAHDQLIIDLIHQYQWCWSCEISNSVQKITDKAIINKWRNKDPICKKFVWYNVIMYFAVARAEVKNFTSEIRSPEWKVCGLCSNRFIENSLPFPLIKRLGIDRLEFCAPCLRDTVLQSSGSDYVSKEQVINYIREFFKITGVIPPSNSNIGYNDLLYLSYEERKEILKILQIRPTNKRVKELFNSWANALQQSGLLGDYSLKTSRGIHTYANDGHLCLSLGERTIDDFFFEHGIKHEKEPTYPDSNFRADFKVGDYLIEYFGMTGDPDYDKKTKIKKDICRTNKIHLISIYPNDLKDEKHLKKKLSILL